MAARMQQYDAARGQRVEFFQQRVHAHAVGFAVEPRVGTDGKARTFKNRDMVFPRRVADPHAGIGEVALEEIRANLQCAGAAESLNGRHALLLENRVVRAKQQRRHGVTVAVKPFHRQIQRGAVRLRVQTRFGFRHRLQLWNDAVFVVVQPDTEVNFVAARIFFEAFH